MSDPSDQDPPIATTALAARPQGAAPEPIPFEPRNVDDLVRLARGLANANILPRALQRQPANLVLVMLKGRELGMSPINALSAVNVIDGKPEMAADSQRALVLKSGKCREFDLLTDDQDKEKAIYRCSRPEWAEGKYKDISFTHQNAVDLGLAGKDNWRKQLSNMLRRRAITKACREIWPDVIVVYDVGEISDVGETPSASYQRVDVALSAGTDWSGDVQPSEEHVEVTESTPTPASTSTSTSRISKTVPAPHGADEVFTRACMAYCKAAGDPSGKLGPAPSSVEQLIAEFEGMLSEVDNPAALRKSALPIIKIFESQAKRSTLCAEAAASMMALYNERAASLPREGTK